MRYLIASDLHGSGVGAKAIRENFEKFNCDKILLLGDILNHGPRNPFPDGYNPREVYEILNSMKKKIICVKGNCDSEVDEMVLDFTLNQSVILEIAGKTIFCTHGHEVNPEKNAKLPSVDYCFYGHFHKLEEKTVENVKFINVGSIGLPKENQPKCFGILDETGVKFYDLDQRELLTEKF